MEERTITLNELIRLAKTRSGLSQETLRKSLQALLGATSEALDEGKRVSLDNFGSFCVRTIEERTYCYSSSSTQYTCYRSKASDSSF